MIAANRQYYRDNKRRGVRFQRIISLPGSEKTTRGFSKATLIVVDEAARVEDQLMASLRPMLATSKDGGKLVMLLTPFGKRGSFYEYWSAGR